MSGFLVIACGLCLSLLSLSVRVAPPPVGELDPISKSRVSDGIKNTTSVDEKLSDVDLMQLYRTAHRQSPIYGHQPPEIPLAIQVLLFDNQHRPITFRPGPTWAIGDEVLHICIDGFRRSPYFHVLPPVVVPDMDPNFTLPVTHEHVVWVADMRRTVFGAKYTIGKQLAYMYEQQRKAQPDLQLSSIVLMDFRDRVPERTLCTKGARQLLKALGPGRVRSVLQQVVLGRQWNPQRNFVDMGTIRDPRSDAVCFGAPTLHVPYTVRSDYFEAIAERTSGLLTEGNPPDTVRPIDVAHFWSIGTQEHAELRNAVTRVVQSFNSTNSVQAGYVSVASKEGRFAVSEAYVSALLSTKIVVTAQRDSWEDHFRLMEAMAGGALVFTDPMHSLPELLVHGESIIVYNSLDELRQLIRYYLEHEEERLAIARAGWAIATNHHRSYHWMERIFFGESKRS